MRKIKRIIALVTVAMFLLSLAAPAAMAATKEDAFGRLNALKVAVGDANGDPQYDKNFTRAEAAAIMVNLQGMNAAIAAAKGPTRFKDVPASHWASGVINLAVGAGIIKGYPDGTYKPDSNVTYAEMSAMLVGVLGYTPKLQGTWPANVIGKAAQLGLLDGVSVTDYNAAAVRSNVFLAADNALDTKPLKETKDGYEEDTKTLMESKLNVTKKTEGYVTNVPNYGADKGKVQIDPTPNAVPANSDDFSVTVADGVDANAHWGEKVVAWVKDDKAFFFDVKTDAASIIYDELDANYNAGTDKVTLKAKDKDYGFAAGAAINRNFVTGAAKATLVKGDKVKVVLDSNGRIAYMEAWNYNKAIVDEVKTADEKIILKTPAGSIELKNDVFSIVKNGKIATLADIKSGDVLDWVENGAQTITNIFASDAVKTGKLTAAAQGTSNYTLTVGDATVKSIGDNAAPSATDPDVMLSDDGGKTFTAANGADGFKAYFNKDVTVKLNKDGKAFAVISTTASDENSSEFPIFVRAVAGEEGLDDYTYIKAGKFDGTNVNYKVTKDTDVNSTDVVEAKLGHTPIAPDPTGHIITNGAARVEAGILNNDLVKVALTSDGKAVDYIKTYTTGVVTNGGSANIGIDKDNDLITINDGIATVAYKVTEETKIIKLKANGDVASVSWAGLESLSVGGNIALSGVNTLKAVTDAGKAKYIVIYDDITVTTDFKYGVQSSHGSDATLGSFVEVDMNGTYTKYKGTFVYADKTMIRFKVSTDNKISNMTTVNSPRVTNSIYATVATTNAASYATFVVKDVDKTNHILKLHDYNGTSELSTDLYITYDPNVQVYSLKGGTLKDKKIEDLSSGDYVKLFDDLNGKGDPATPDGSVDFIVIQDI